MPPPINLNFQYRRTTKTHFTLFARPCLLVVYHLPLGKDVSFNPVWKFTYYLSSIIIRTNLLLFLIQTLSFGINVWCLSAVKCNFLIAHTVKKHLQHSPAIYLGSFSLIYRDCLSFVVFGAHIEISRKGPNFGFVIHLKAFQFNRL